MERITAGPQIQAVEGRKNHKRENGSHLQSNVESSDLPKTLATSCKGGTHHHVHTSLTIYGMGMPRPAKKLHWEEGRRLLLFVLLSNLLLYGL